MPRRLPALLLLLLALPLVSPEAAGAEPAPGPAEELFARKCGSCHTVGKGVRVGPDLKDAHKRRSRAWLLGFVKQPSALLDSDADARNLLAQFNGVRMPDLGLSNAEAATLVDLIVRCSTEPCSLAGKFTAARLATKQDVARGRDLTNAFARIGDEGLDAALAQPAYPLMNKVFALHPLDPAEAFALRAFLYQANLGGEPARDATLSVTLFGGLGAAVSVVALNAAWRRRLRGVRKPLTQRRATAS